MQRIGIIGVGAMGLAMAQRLRETGHEVAVRDIDPARETLALESACRVLPSPAALAAAVDLLIVTVVDAAQMQAVLFGPDGAFEAMRAGSTVLLCATVGPQDVERAATTLLARGIGVLDAPMSGGPQRARAGTMSLMVAGADNTFQHCLPLLQALSSRLFRVGIRPGDGARTKLVNNLLAAVNLAGAAEALGLAQRLGLDPAATLAVIEQSSGHSWIASDRARRALAGDTAVQARLTLLAKDSALACAAAGVAPLPLGRLAAATFAKAVLLGDSDDAALISRALASPATAPPLPDAAENAP